MRVFITPSPTQLCCRERGREKMEAGGMGWCGKETLAVRVVASLPRSDVAEFSGLGSKAVLSLFRETRSHTAAAFSRDG